MNTTLSLRDAVKKARPKGFPLTPHGSGSWMKKIRGHVHYFGPWGRRVDGKLERLPDDGREAALARWLDEKDDLLAGREPRHRQDDGLTLLELCDRYLVAKQQKLESGALCARSFLDNKKTCERLLATLGKKTLVEHLNPDDFARLRSARAKHMGPNTLSNEVVRVRSIFKFALQRRLIREPVDYADAFDVPNKKAKRKHKQSNGPKLFEAAEVRKLIDNAPPVLKACILLAINTGIGNTDLATMRFRHIDLDKAWLNRPREKTGVDRQAPLWEETVAALRQAIEKRPKPSKADKDIVLLMPGVGRLVQEVTVYDDNGDIADVKSRDHLGEQFDNLRKRLKIPNGRGFYSLRRTFATIAAGARDRDAVQAIMGHEESDMLSNYVLKGPEAERLKAVTDHVHDWLFAQEGGQQ